MNLLCETPIHCSHFKLVHTLKESPRLPLKPPSASVSAIKSRDFSGRQKNSLSQPTSTKVKSQRPPQPKLNNSVPLIQSPHLYHLYPQSSPVIIMKLTRKFSHGYLALHRASTNVLQFWSPSLWPSASSPERSPASPTNLPNPCTARSRPSGVSAGARRALSTTVATTVDASSGTSGLSSATSTAAAAATARPSNTALGISGRDEWDGMLASSSRSSQMGRTKGSTTLWLEVEHLGILDLGLEG